MLDDVPGPPVPVGRGNARTSSQAYHVASPPENQRQNAARSASHAARRRPPSGGLRRPNASAIGLAFEKIRAEAAFDRAVSELVAARQTVARQGGVASASADATVVSRWPKRPSRAPRRARRQRSPDVIAVGAGTKGASDLRAGRRHDLPIVRGPDRQVRATDPRRRERHGLGGPWARRRREQHRHQARRPSRPRSMRRATRWAARRGSSATAPSGHGGRRRPAGRRTSRRCRGDRARGIGLGRR